MRKTYLLMSVMVLFKWGIGQAHASLSQSPSSDALSSINRHPRYFRGIHLDSRQIRNADYSSNTTPPGPDIKPEPEKNPNPPTHKPANQGPSSTLPNAESKNGKPKAARSIGKEVQQEGLMRNPPLFFDAHIPEETVPSWGNIWKRDARPKQKQPPTLEDPTNPPVSTSHLETRTSYIDRMPRKIDGVWGNKRQEMDHKHSSSPYDDIARAPDAIQADGGGWNREETLSHGPTPDKSTIVSPSKHNADTIQDTEISRHIIGQKAQWPKSDENFKGHGTN